LFEQHGRPRHEVSLLFHVERIRTGEVISQEPAIDFGWFPLSDLPMDLRPRLIREWLQLPSPKPTWIPANLTQFAPPSP
jgi:hypothetical protein